MVLRNINIISLSVSFKTNTTNSGPHLHASPVTRERYARQRENILSAKMSEMSN